MDVRGFTLGTMLLAMSAQPARAQVLDRPSSTEPRAWISGALGLFDPGVVDDGVTATSWRFANAAQFRGSLEYSLGRGNSIGVLAAYARVPLRYAPFSGSAEDALSTVSALALTFHGGGGVGLHQVIEASVGALRYSDFTSEQDGRRLAPLGADLDVTFMIGGGFGYSIGTRTQIVLVQDFGIALHQRTDLPNDASTSTYHRTTRLGLRHGVGTATRR
jgi:hypothetical protein